MATKQELIDFYHSECERYFEAAQDGRVKAANAADEEDAHFYSKAIRENALIASICKQFVKNLEEMEG
ncbi:hypothetical protein HUG15_05635 [Salicibibacter cibarius]|uniref:Uncharacterized protein n=1 Tax=Salicibibacter cibarius TaxID=2743000 RepID=A0A7T7CAN0_9BACI|nr:hypothetical protein [Salicibibacter cibarius]QQK75074.1 hypothetical protein HUG15_05300 [Salicibibacter cibarius]QQK75135.1 hypothetical protein HUG15_05635 [Salicibibacter cibarius]